MVDLKNEETCCESRETYTAEYTGTFKRTGDWQNRFVMIGLAKPLETPLNQAMFLYVFVIFPDFQGMAGMAGMALC